MAAAVHSSTMASTTPSLGPLALPDTTTAAPVSADIHAVVLLSILDHHLRRAEKSNANGVTQDRAVGVLLGSNTAGVVEVTNSFGVLHVQHTDPETGKEEVLIKNAAVKDLLALHRKVNDKEQIVGWYSTASGNGTLLDDISLIFQEFFETLCLRPIHVVVDTRLLEDKIDVKAFVTSNNAHAKNVVVAFQELKATVVATPEAMVGIESMTSKSAAFAAAAAGGAAAGVQAATPSTEIMPDIEALSSSMRKLKSLLDASLAYVDDVVAGKREGDEAVGRALADTLAAVPTVDAAGFGRAFTTALRDVLMSSYLTTITAAQMKLAERISGIVPTLPGERDERDRDEEGDERRGPRRRDHRDRDDRRGDGGDRRGGYDRRGGGAGLDRDRRGGDRGDRR